MSEIITSGEPANLSGMSEPADHDLERVLAQWAGVEIKEQACGPTNLSWYYWLVTDEDEWPEGEWVKWTPLTDANQIEEVEARVVKDYNLECARYMEFGLWDCHIWKDGFSVVLSDPDKKRAFALAVWAMEQSQPKETA